MITSDFVRSEQVVIDVGINMLDGKLCGDVDFEAVADNVQAITPVPGGVGTVTTSVLLKHTIRNAMKL
jgi:methylenetetrahydrofolate dehydrogenase (NADP+)/methenyltetrahydrofolate cyclohydrolase